MTPLTISEQAARELVLKHMRAASIHTVFPMPEDGEPDMFCGWLTYIELDNLARSIAALASPPEPTAGGGVESLRRLSEKATPGEWHVDPKAPEESYFEDVNIIRPDGLAVAVAVQNADIVPPQPEANASFIVACVNYVRALLSSPSPDALKEEG